jgi:Tol biopolymer transport system component
MAWWLMAGSVSPSGREIAATYWVVNRPGNTGDLVVVDAETGAVRVAGETMAGTPDGSSGDTYVNGFVWANDGSRIAYSEWNFDSAPGFQALHVANSDGSGHRIVSNNPQNADLRPRAWSSDGQWVIAFATGWDDVTRIVKISLDDGSTTIVKTLRSGFGETQRRYMTLSLSPDDRYLTYAYSATPQGEPDVHVLAVDGSSETVVAPNGATDLNPLWTPDGLQLVFLSDRSGTADFWAVEMSDGMAVSEPFVVHGSVGPVQPLGFTGDGALTYLKNVSVQDLRVVDLTDDVELLDQDEPLTDRFIGANSDPVWSPDGTRVAFRSNRAGAGLDLERYLVVRSLDGGAERDIPLEGFLFYANGQTRPQWSADGRSVVLPTLHAERTENGMSMESAFHRVDVETGEISREPHLWSSQGLHYYATGRQEERLRSLGIRIDGFRWIVEAIEGGHDALKPGERLLWFRNTPGWVTEFGCDQERDYPGALCVFDGRLLIDPIFGEPKTVRDLGSWRLSPDGSTVAYLLRGDEGRRERDLWVRSVTMDDQPTLLRAGLALGTSVNWTLDGRYVLFTEAVNAEVAPIFRIAVEGGGEPEPVPWPLEARQLDAMSFDPEGRRAVLPVGSDLPINEIWALSGFPWEEVGRE